MQGLPFPGKRTRLYTLAGGHRLIAACNIPENAAHLSKKRVRAAVLQLSSTEGWRPVGDPGGSSLTASARSKQARAAMFVPSFFKGRFTDNASQTSGSSANSGLSSATAQPGVGRRETSAKYAEPDVSTAQWSARSTSQDDSTTQHRSAAVTRPTPSGPLGTQMPVGSVWPRWTHGPWSMVCCGRIVTPCAPRGATVGCSARKYPGILYFLLAPSAFHRTSLDSVRPLSFDVRSRETAESSGGKPAAAPGFGELRSVRIKPPSSPTQRFQRIRELSRCLSIWP